MDEEQIHVVYPKASVLGITGMRRGPGLQHKTYRVGISSMIHQRLSMYCHSHEIW